jgi:hypothetical protein
MNLDMDRPKKLGISLAQLVSNTPEIIIAAQHRKSLQVADLDSIESWVTTQINQIRAVSDRPILVRPHPRSRLDISKLPLNTKIETPTLLANTYDSFNMHFDCHAVVNYNSGPGIQAAISGSRPIVDVTSLAYPVGVKLENLEQPYDVDRYHWLVEICHTEYTISEIQQGLWLKRIRSAL